LKFKEFFKIYLKQLLLAHYAWMRSFVFIRQGILQVEVVVDEDSEDGKIGPEYGKIIK